MWVCGCGAAKGGTEHMARRCRTRPVALSIAGSDSGGGAGIQADLRAFSFFGVFGTTALTAVTAQNPKGVTGVAEIPLNVVRKQIEAVLVGFDVRAIKTGMLYSAPIIEEVAGMLAVRRRVPVVVDPVMIATSGARLLREDAIRCLCERLLPLATVMTPNLPEAEAILGSGLSSLRAVRRGARALAREYGVTVVVKGGHLEPDGEVAVDVVCDGTRLWEVAAPRVQATTTHGTGCSFSAALAACLARGEALMQAIHCAKAYVTGSLASCVRVGRGTYALASPDELVLADVRVRQVS